jgi:hypothetical protein
MNVLALDVTRLSQPLSESAEQWSGCASRYTIKKPDHRHRGLLRARRQRPCRRRAAEKCDELAPFNRLTPSPRITR